MTGWVAMMGSLKVWDKICERQGSTSWSCTAGMPQHSAGWCWGKKSGTRSPHESLLKPQAIPFNFISLIQLQLLALQKCYINPAWPHKDFGCLRRAYQAPLMPNLINSSFIVSSHRFFDSSWPMLASSFPKVDGKGPPNPKCGRMASPQHLLWSSPAPSGWCSKWKHYQ